MHVSKAIVMLGIGVAAVLGSFGIRLLLAARVPLLPKTMPQNSIWVPGPTAPLDLSPRGVWLGCWLDRTRNIHHCKVTDYKGNIQFDEDFLPVTGSVPVSDERLRLKKIGTMELWTWNETAQREVPVVHLQDGTILIPARDFAGLHSRYGP